MSYQVDGVCYSVPLSAISAIASKETGRIVNLGNSSYVVDVSALTDSSITYLLTDLTTSSTITKTVSITLQPCGLLDTSDGLIIGWGIAAAWLVTYGIMFLKRGLHE